MGSRLAARDELGGYNVYRTTIGRQRGALVAASIVLLVVAALPITIDVGSALNSAGATSTIDERLAGQLRAAALEMRSDRYNVVAINLTLATLVLLGLWVQASRNGRRIQALQRAASTDPLTGLLNRGQVLAGLAASAAPTGKGTWVMLLDLDGFKSVNDTLGHAAGDQLLVAVARRIRRAVRDGDLVGRLGGDEFVVILLDVDPVEDPIVVAERIALAVAAPFRLGPRSIRTTVSIGVAEIVCDGDVDRTCPLGSADMALYEAKELGGGQIVTFDDGIDSRIERRKSLEEKLRSASAVDQFTLYFQPECDLQSNEVVGAEALLRWSTPDHTVVEATEFIDGLDETGLLIDLAPRIVEEASMFAETRSREHPFTMRINMTAEQLMVPDMVSVLDRAVTRCEPARLCVELSSHSLAEPTPEIVTRLREIQQVGVEVAIDDFGTGNACLLLLNSLYVDELKIDRRLVEELAFCDPETSIAVAMIRIARSRGLRVSALGIETPEQMVALRDAGCDRGQGYLFGPAVGPKQFDERAGISALGAQPVNHPPSGWMSSPVT